MTIAFGAIGAKGGGGSAIAAYPTGINAGDMGIGASAYWSSGVAPTDLSGWVRTNIQGGTGSSIDNHISMARGDYKELTGSESGSVTFPATGVGGAQACMARYTKTAASWDTVVTATGDDNSHGANRSISTIESFDYQPGDMIVIVVATDTDSALTITSPSLTASGVTFGTVTRRTPATAGSTTGQDGNVEVFDALVSSGTGTGLTFAFTTATSQCGPAVFIRLREGSPDVTVTPSRISPPAATIFSPTLQQDVTPSPARISPPTATVFAPTVTAGSSVTVTPARINGVATVPGIRAIRTWDDIPGETMIWGGTSGHPYTTTGGTGSTFDLDHTAEYALGDRSIKVTTNGTNQNTFVRKLNGTSVDWTDKTPRIWFKVDHKDRIADLVLWLGSGGALTNAYKWAFKDLDMTVTYYNDNEWVCLTLPWSKATVAGTPNRAALTDLNMQIFDGSVGVLNFWWGGLSAVPERTSVYPNGVVSFTFDDGLDDHYDIAAPYLQGKGFVGTAFIISDRIDLAGFMTEAEMIDLQNTYGWELGLHSDTVADHDASTAFNSLTDSQIGSNLSANRSFLTGAGADEPESFAYPQGYFNEATAKSVGDRVRNARTTKGLMLNTAPVGDRRKIFCVALDSSTSTATIESLVDQAKANQEWLVLLFHQIVPSGATGGQVLQSTFETIVDYVQTQGVAVQTVGGVQNLEPPGVTVHPARINGSTQVFSPTLKSDVTVTPARIDATTTVFSPTVQTGATVTPSRVSVVATVMAAAITASAVIAPARIDGTTTVQSPTVQTGATPTPARINGATTVQSPTLISHATVTPARIDGTTTVFAPTVSAAGNATPQPARIQTSATIYRPTIRLPAYVMQRERAISISGAEFTPGSNPATQAFSNVNIGTYDSDYRYEGITTPGTTENSLTFDYLAGRGWKTVKIPIRWERIQPTLNAALNTTELNRLTAELDQADGAGLKVILDVHNYGLYYIDGSVKEPPGTTNTGYRFAIGSTEVPESSFADLWSRLATAFNSHAAVVGAHLMNEPQAAGGLTRAVWYSAAQAAVDAIRAVNSTWVIRIGGWQWSDVFNWTSNNLAPWISDPTGKILYEGHHYWAETNDAQYTTYANALADAITRGYTAGSETDALHSRILDELNDFKAWGTTYDVAQVVGETGWPGNASGGDQALWDALGDRYLEEADNLNMHVDAWSTGEFYGNVADPLLIYHASNAVTSGVDTTRADADEWEAHLVGDALVTPSRINAVATVFAPSIQTGATVTPARIDSVTQITNPTIRTGAGPIPARISTTANIFAPSVIAEGNATVTPARISVATTIFVPTVQTGTTATPARITTATTVFAPTIVTTATVTPVRILGTTLIFAPIIDVGGFEPQWSPNPDADELENPAGADDLENLAGADGLENPAGANALTANSAGANLLTENPAGADPLEANTAGATLQENPAGATWEVT